MTDKDPQKSGPKLPDSAPEVYNRLLERVYLSIGKVEERSWPYIKDQIEEAARIELAAEEMTREELDLLQAYLQRDLREAGTALHKTGEGLANWLNFDLQALEYTLVERLFGLADQTRIDQTELQLRLDHGPEDYLAGEVAAAGQLRCLECGALVKLPQTTLIEPCHQCNNRFFHRDSGVWDK
ncbi:metalloendopeptidase [Motiliproteus coralliicola]|uniref:Metalloendopeptidase n=1 Tax=Motiliproteus coralliicola TaxID=2283196 RepID=A0A369WSQ4_9GAMM|nr:zinc ribbon-containing protein [Motiliproteus coralliicola]RDE24109.1 metalloendopeptidase [Motiliproteus coralliicola]